ncbi:tRNA (adenosine(37)-N6)-threonylcarbamoyltransferase complex ATPase subunit type 1 TsaE [Candidatus Microgenomates bacterium]|nr:tRNA (adenosine(37)-N6)-threonylcarbamoyltransferase complex ATPase subunit type 1 TsaE [Candidatus Microgenomates bacterium]
MQITTNNDEQTKNLGKRVGEKLTGREILALVGPLGAGKTTFVQGLAEGLGIKNRITSPTFIIMRKYKIKLKSQNSNVKTTTKNLKLMNFYHVDLYRLEQNLEQEIKNLGLDEIWGKRENIMAIEWADKISRFLPDNTQWIKFNVTDDEKHLIELPEELT